MRLIGDAELRRGLVEESRKLIEQFYRIVRSAKPLAHAMGLAKNGAPDGARRTRLLVVNTSFRPQSIGGATPIAESYALDIASRYGAHFEVLRSARTPRRAEARPTSCPCCASTA